MWSVRAAGRVICLKCGRMICVGGRVMWEVIFVGVTMAFTVVFKGVCALLLAL